MRLHPDAIAIVASLIRAGRAGDKPFGVPLALWEVAMTVPHPPPTEKDLIRKIVEVTKPPPPPPPPPPLSPPKER